MVSAIYCNYTPYSEKERAKAILFAGVPVDSFKFVFVFNGIKYFKKVK